MIIIPAIDIKNGKCVRLLQGCMDKETVFSSDVALMAKQWENQGASMIHVVDLDGAVEKKLKNNDSIIKIINAVNIPVQVGGGIRNIETINMLIDLGVKRVVIGTEAVKNPQFVKDACKHFKERVVVGIDARNGLVAVEGWTTATHITAIDLAKRYEDCGVAAINFTDIQRDGMQTGPNIEETRLLAQSVKIPIVASGGVSNINDILNLIPLCDVGLVGVIVGRAIYSGTLNLKEAIELVNLQQ